MVLFPLTPLSRCGSVVLDFMMKFNQSVIVSDVLTFLLDAARQDKFGAFNPGSINKFWYPQMAWRAQRKVNITKGGEWSFQKCLQVSFLLKMMDFFYLYSESIFFKQPFLWERGQVWAKFGPSLIGRLPVIVVVVFILSNKIWFLQIS